MVPRHHVEEWKRKCAANVISQLCVFVCCWTVWCFRALVKKPFCMSGAVPKSLNKQWKLIQLIINNRVCGETMTYAAWSHPCAYIRMHLFKLFEWAYNLLDTHAKLRRVGTTYVDGVTCVGDIFAQLRSVAAYHSLDSVPLAFFTNMV